jgi:hypothetical protein
MTLINDLIEDWIQIRSTLQRHIRMLEAEKEQNGTDIYGAKIDDTVGHLKAWVSALNKLLKEHSIAARS